MQCRVLGHQQFSSLSLPMGNIDLPPAHDHRISPQPHQSRGRQTSTADGHDISAEWSARASPQGVELQPPCSGARDYLNCLRWLQGGRIAVTSEDSKSPTVPQEGADYSFQGNRF